MKKIIFIIIFLSIKSYSQNDLYDYIITSKNDTIFGSYQDLKLIDLNKKKHRINSDDVVEIKKNDCIYRLMTVINKDFYSNENDSLIDLKITNTRPLLNKKSTLYIRKLDKNLRKDYIITIQNDTIYGQIELSTFNNYKLTKKSGEKIKISPRLTLEFRKDGFKYLYKKKRPYTIGDKRHAYLKLIYDDKVKLFDYTIIGNYPSAFNLSNSFSSKTYYYVERDDEIELITPQRISSILKFIIPENKILLKKIKSREFTHKNMYIIIKYFNTMTKI